MTAHPKQKVTKSNAGKRRAHQALKKLSLTDCPTCGEKALPHHVCPNCGQYKGKQVLAVKAASK